VSDISLDELELCFEGAIPAVIATASADGIPNVTYLSRVCMVDNERIALSNQFFSKTVRNLSENPRASVMVLDPTTYAQYRLTVVYERTERRGALFERLREDVDAVAALHHMEDVFKLRAADIYRVLHVDRVLSAADRRGEPLRTPVPHRRTNSDTALAELANRIARAPDLDAIVSIAVHGLAELLDFGHSLLMLLDEEGRHLYTIASHGYDTEGVGSEVTVGEGIIGMAAARAAPIRIGNLHQMDRYGRRVRDSFEDAGEIAPGRDIPVPGLPGAQSRVAVPALALNQLVGVLMVESHRPVAFYATDEALLTVVAALVANAIEVERAREATADAPAARPLANTETDTSAPATHVRFFAVDGSTFLDGDYLIKGVAGRILWSLLGHYDREGRVEFTNKEVRLDPSLELPEFRDNLDSRLLLLKRRLDERSAPIRIEKTGRGRFRLIVHTSLRLDEVRAAT
jgi:predicted pyridoxine 5'-phosphate oxidase superfamily flavin-nucleotide-binding protein